MSSDMGLTAWCGLIAAWGVLAVNVAYLVYSFRAARQWRRLNRLYMELCMSAWQMRQWPIARRILDIPGPPDPEPPWWRRRSG